MTLTSAAGDKWIALLRHHRHWQKILSIVSGCKLSMFDFTLPKEGTIAGGTMTLRGNSFSLACFHGINFRCKSWALFVMDEPIVHFATEAQEIINDGQFVFIISRSLRSRSGNLLTKPKACPRLGCHTSFVHAAPKLWDKLPVNIRTTTFLASFRPSITTHLFKLAYA